MLLKIDYYLAGIVFGLSFFMIAIEESSLYTILPKYMARQSIEKINNETLVLSFNSSVRCSIENPPYVTVSMIFLAKNLMMLIINPIIGAIVDKRDNCLILILAQILGVIVSIIYAYGNSILLYIIGRIIDSFVTCMIFIAIFSLISKLFGDFTVRGRYYGFINVLYSISHSIGPVYGAEIDEKLEKPTVFLLLIPLWIICLLLTYILQIRISNSENKLQTNLINTIASHSTQLTLLINSNTNNNALEEDLLGSVKISDDHFLNIVSIKDENKGFFPGSQERKHVALCEILSDPVVISCLIKISVVNLSMFSLPPTLPSWMAFKLCCTEVQQGIVWTFGFLGYIAGVAVIILIDANIPKTRYLAAIFSQIVVGILLILLPFAWSWTFVFLPVMMVYISVGIGEQIVFPLTTHLADSRFHSNYGAMSSLTSQSMNICAIVSTLCSGPIAMKFGFRSLAISLGVIHLVFSPISLVYRNIIPV